MQLQYQTGKPEETGVYACRIKLTGDLLQDVFLLWQDGKWWYLFSDQKFRDDVPFFLGPLPRTRSTRRRLK